MNIKPRFRRIGIRLRNTEAGQSLVEFTLVLPILLLLLFALVDFGRAFYTWNTVTNAAREGARTAAIQSDTATVQTAIRSAMSNLTNDPSKYSWSAGSPSGIQGPKGSTVTITVSYPFTYVTPISPILRILGGSGLANPTLSSSTSMRME